MISFSCNLIQSRWSRVSHLTTEESMQKSENVQAESCIILLEEAFLRHFIVVIELIQLGRLHWPYRRLHRDWMTMWYCDMISCERCEHSCKVFILLSLLSAARGNTRELKWDDKMLKLIRDKFCEIWAHDVMNGEANCDLECGSKLSSVI